MTLREVVPLKTYDSQVKKVVTKGTFYKGVTGLKKVSSVYKVFMMIFILVISAALTGCGGSDSAGSKGGKKVEITWLVRTDANMIEWEKKTIKDFEAKNPNIKVKLETIPQDEIDQRLTTMISSGNVPDVWSSNWANSGFATYRGMDALLDLTSYVENDAQQLSGIPEHLMDIYKIDGKIYGIPMLGIGSYLFYNKDLFDEAGLEYPPTDWNDTSWNWDKALEYAKTLTKDTGKSADKIYGLLDNNSPARKAWTFGGEFWKPEAYTTGVMGEPAILDNPKNAEALQFFTDLINKHKVSPNPSALDAVSQLGDPFMTGKVAMVVNGGWGFWAYKPAEFNWGVAPIPYADGRIATLYVDPWNISAKSKHPDESWEFVKFLADPNGAAKSFMEATSATPADATLMDDWYQQMSDITGMSVEEIKEVNDGAFVDGKEADNHLITKFSIIGTTIDQTMTAVYEGKKTVQEGLEEIDKNLRSLKLE